MTDESPRTTDSVTGAADAALSGFADQAELGSRNFAVELVDFLREEKKWWLVPIILCLAVIAIFALLLTTPAAPFIYPGIM